MVYDMLSGRQFLQRIIIFDAKRSPEFMTDSQDQNIRRVFEEGFCARDIAQLIRSFDAETPLDRAVAIMKETGCSIVGVRTAGVVSGYIHSDTLAGSCCGDALLPFAPEQLVNGTLPLAALVQRLDVHPCCFVVAWDQVWGYVRREDVQKPPGRMWLFGMVTLIESRFGRLIETHCPEEEWKACMSPGRILKAETLWAERVRSGQQVRLVDCLQFADKAQIVAHVERLRAMTRFDSKKQIEAIGRKLEKLRNNLAHSQDIIIGDWKTIVTLAENITMILDGPPQQRSIA